MTDEVLKNRKEYNMELRGCREGKGTPRLSEVICPVCGEIIEVFVRMDGGPGVTGTLAQDEKCPKCGYIAKEGTPETEFELA